MPAHELFPSTNRDSAGRSNAEPSASTDAAPRETAPRETAPPDATSTDAVFPAAGLPADHGLSAGSPASRFVVPTTTGYELRDAPADATGDPDVNSNEFISQPDSISRLVATLRNHTVRRLLYTVCRDGDAPKPLRDQLQANGIELVEVIVHGEHQSVGADDFMPAEDSALVAERLRELGYI